MRTSKVTEKIEALRDKVVQALKDAGISCRKTYYDAVLYDIPSITIPITTRRNIIPEEVRSIMDTLNVTEAEKYTSGHRTSSGKVLKFVAIPKKETK